MKSHNLDRRQFIKTSIAATAVATLPLSCSLSSKKLYDISLAQWSVNRRILRSQPEKMDVFGFVNFTKDQIAVGAVEYVNTLMGDTRKDKTRVAKLRKHCDNSGMKSLLIMVDREGNLGEPNKKNRIKNVENHKHWVEAAKTLGCHSIRVNARSKGSREEQHKLCVDGLHMLGSWAYENHGINVIVENHGGLSSQGDWMAAVLKAVELDSVGSLPDFGNFGSYDRYKGTKELMPYAKGVSAKTHGFNAVGNAKRTDYRKMMKIVVDAGYDGYVGIEYEGGGSDIEGILKTKTLLETVRAEIASGKI